MFVVVLYRCIFVLELQDAATYRDELKEISPHTLLKCSSEATTLVWQASLHHVTRALVIFKHSSLDSDGVSLWSVLLGSFLQIYPILVLNPCSKFERYMLVHS